MDLMTLDLAKEVHKVEPDTAEYVGFWPGAEYRRFAARRRVLLEAEAERAQQKALEDAVKALSVPGKKATPRRPRGRKS